MRSNRRSVLFLLVAGVVVHAGVLGVAWRRGGGIDGYAFRSLDSSEYYAIARNLLEHGAFSQAAEPPFDPDTWRTPGYPLFLALCMLILGQAPWKLILVQQVLSIGNMLLLYGVARRPLGDRRATAAAVLFLLEPYHLYYSLWLLTTTLFTSAVLVLWHCWQRLQARPTLPAHLAAGFVAGALVLIWPVGALIPPALLVGLGVRRWQAERRQSRLAGLSGECSGMGTPLGNRPAPDGCAAEPVVPLPDRRGSFSSSLLHVTVCIAAFLLACALPIGGWMVRNRLVAGTFGLSHQPGIVLSYFKATEVILWREGRSAERYLETSLDPARRNDPHPVWERIDGKLQAAMASLPADERAALSWRNLAQGNKTDIDAFAISSALARIAWEELTDSPWATITCYATRVLEILSFPLPLTLTPPRGVEVNRLRAACVGALYTALALLAVYAILRRRGPFHAWFFPLACTLALLVAATPQVDPRFRVPMIPLLLLFAFLPSHGNGADGVDQATRRTNVDQSAG